MVEMNKIRKMAGWMVAIGYRLLKPRSFNEWVVFHHLEPRQFEKLIVWYHARGLDRKLTITFDDGWKEVAEYAKTLERYGLKAKLFIAPRETLRGHVWTEEAARKGIADWRRLYRVGVGERERVLGFSSSVSASVGDGRSLLTKDEILALPKCIEIENHTMSHLSATDRPVEEVIDEVREAQRTLAEWTGRSPRFIAWPFGRGDDELDRRVRALGLEPVYTNPGRPHGRTMAIEGASFLENLGRLLGAWPKVGVTK